MSIKRFVAPSGREALAQVRRELGEDALVLSTRRLTGGRIEVLAAGADDMRSMIAEAGIRAGDAAPAAAAPAAAPAVRVHAPAESASVLTFDEFLQRQQRLAEATEVEPARQPAADRPASVVPQAAGSPGAEDLPSVFRRRGEAAGAVPAAAAAPANAVAPAGAAEQRATEAPIGGADARLLAELQTMRALLLEQMAAMGAATSAAEFHRRSPMQVRAMTRLLTAGFSPEVARQIAERAPAAATPADSDRWLAEVLAVNLRSADAAGEWLGRGGVYALVGPTGVGKTTTVAKLAARFAVHHGAPALGLVTLDAFRVGAHEQLRAYGRILGTPVHLAQDAAALRELLAAMAGKRLVLIDTCGVSQRDERLQDVLAILDEAGGGERPIERLLLLNAASHAETLDDVARAWRAALCAGAVLTKLDEAVRIGGALDCALRHRLVLHGATHGQRVPEDWLAIGGPQLASLALRPGHGPFALAEAEAAVIAAAAERRVAAPAG